jgi:hypothetical protein
MPSSYRGDPHWIMVRYRGTCHKCGTALRKWDEAWYYPKGKHLYCKPCGEPMALEFSAAVADEDFMNRNW